LAVRRPAIDRLFGGNEVEGILDALDRESSAESGDTEFAKTCAALIRAKSPTSLKIALAQLRGGPGLDFDECMRTEFRIVSRLVRGHDLYEGIRAVIIDKDQAPLWRPPSLPDVSRAEVERHFAPLPVELDLP
jgi:enoyl-CoA hydratase